MPKVPIALDIELRFAQGTKPPRTGTRTRRSTTRSGGPARRGQAKGSRGSAVDRRHLECPASRRAGAVVLPHDRRRDCGRVPWLTFSSPTCKQFGSVDLRTLIPRDFERQI